MAFQTFNEFKEESINEGLFDKLLSWMNSIANLFNNPETVQQSVQAAITDAGDASPKAFDPKAAAQKSTYFIMMGDSKDANTNFSISLTKLADLPDGSGLFQFTGTTNTQMLKDLTGTGKITDLMTNDIMAIISPQSISVSKPADIKILKNIMPQGKDYISKYTVIGIAPGEAVTKTINKNKK